ncbi:bifunctional UDP-N-acetylmuramoyl-tripeptide:D-alanyl-D-alanine ligase/alanine racemase [Pontibacter sp. SGAir0037]|uniref:bifunctional UDP-N-acetylmuramoyl-tripeptide:D-alanyl-D-alanine ligase/alanine racemase n=1 Tax=Pontibacter sp. SGAir0037 TaxID=2571030 RepID=UPI0010CD175E|nr:bifunctional UDP-N-acetylmuramoyl-tripeptide:D-alanyl-D-alanine ligase/alanine racemase [Pontibacter sp. SGAir0037]QCR24279.1 bifunctional UDP-N-acetylmuramoyl-tripeptide:D-alanyl-D-alanine ligase/alanine racemase [Pontibacter sp. SGAir0037]
MLKFQELISITQGQVLQYVQQVPVQQLFTDSRKLSQSAGTLFFAIKGTWNDGHRYLASLYEQGVRQFVVEKASEELKQELKEANILEVKDSLKALQDVAAWHRKQFSIPVIGITGSNGKTIVKEWLAQLLSADEQVVKSPRSYNSQLGVPLSVWQLNSNHTLGIFEAGISLPGEMDNLQSIIQPTWGIFTNIGSAHDEGFASRQQKVAEKLKLFSATALLFYCSDHELIHQAVKEKQLKTFTWSRSREADVTISGMTAAGHKTIVVYNYLGQKQRLAIPFTDEASVENVLHCLAVLLYRGLPLNEIQDRLDRLHPVAMRLEMKEAINGCYLIDDTYNNDLAGLAIALDLLASQPKREKHTLILSDLLQSGLQEEALYKQVAELVQARGVQRLIGIGTTISAHAHQFACDCTFFPGTTEFLEQFRPAQFQNEVILIKGARVFEFERIVQAFQQKVHGTVLEVNLDALVHNLNFYRSKIAPGTKLMVMVKAFAYGSGSFEVANLLQFHNVDYLAVAYADEGVMLREHGITVPIMVMNPSSDSFAKLRQYNLEPEIYSLEQLEAFGMSLPKSGIFKIHLKLDTGMHRLGFTAGDFKQLFSLLSQYQQVQVISTFSHLAGADEALHNDFSETQIATFRKLAAEVEENIGYKVIKHILNSAGIVRFPQHQLDMVRLGIGLYGVEATGSEQEALRPVSTLKTTISQIKEIKQGETVGYSRKGVADVDKKIATIAIGYADGYDRRFSNGVGQVLVNGSYAPVIGNVCMDMCMVDITGIEAKAGSEVTVFGPQLTLVELAKKIGTIPYELLTNVSSRVKRVFYAE